MRLINYIEEIEQIHLTASIADHVMEDVVVSALRKNKEKCLPGIVFSKIDKVSHQVFKDARYDNF